jgi:Flp pilus assembly protein TadG
MLERLGRDRKGAVLAEFMLAIVPVLTMFFTFVQLSRVASARLVVKHSAIVGARAAAVIANGKNNTPDQEKKTNEDQITTGVKAALGPWWSKPGGITSVIVKVTDTSSRADPYNWVEVKVSATYACRVPMGFLACAGPSKLIVETFKMPHQGALYEMESSQ